MALCLSTQTIFEEVLFHRGYGEVVPDLGLDVDQPGHDLAGDQFYCLVGLARRKRQMCHSNRLDIDGVQQEIGGIGGRQFGHEFAAGGNEASLMNGVLDGHRFEVGEDHEIRAVPGRDCTEYRPDSSAGRGSTLPCGSPATGRARRRSRCGECRRCDRVQ